MATLVALAAAGGCGAPGPELTFADWILPLAEDIPVREYAPIAIEDRDPDAVRLVEDLVIGGDPSDPNGSFYQPMGVAASPSGDIFVLERGNRRIQMFDAERLRWPELDRSVQAIRTDGEGRLYPSVA